MWMSIARLTGVSVLALTLGAGIALAEGEDQGEPPVDGGEVILIDPIDEGVIIDPICIECSGEGEWTDEGSGGDDGWVDDGEVVVYDDGEVVYEYLEDRSDDIAGEGDGSEGEPVDGAEGDPEMLPTSDCGGCEAWHDGGPIVPEVDRDRPLSPAYRAALCSTEAFDDLAICSEVATR